MGMGMSTNISMNTNKYPFPFDTPEHLAEECKSTSLEALLFYAPKVDEYIQNNLKLKYMRLSRREWIATHRFILFLVSHFRHSSQGVKFYAYSQEKINASEDEHDPDDLIICRAIQKISKLGFCQIFKGKDSERTLGMSNPFFIIRRWKEFLYDKMELKANNFVIEFLGDDEWTEYCHFVDFKGEEDFSPYPNEELLNRILRQNQKKIKDGTLVLPENLERKKKETFKINLDDVVDENEEEDSQDEKPKKESQKEIEPPIPPKTFASKKKAKKSETKKYSWQTPGDFKLMCEMEMKKSSEERMRIRDLAEYFNKGYSTIRVRMKKEKIKWKNPSSYK